MQTAPKFTHVASHHRAGQFALVALCGRRVGILSLTDEAGATCPKCVAESLTLPNPATQEGTRG